MKRYKRPESVLVLVYTRAGEVLLLQRRDVPDFWQSVTGSLHRDESPVATAWRELSEETGLSSQDGELVDCQQCNRFPIAPPWSHRYAPGTTHNLEHVFRFAMAAKADIQINPCEHQNYCWLDKTAALRQVSSYTNKAAIEQWLELGW
jgi:dATP pyrophosphohydrolase